MTSLLAAGAHALDSSPARTPPMGWNPWNVFGHTVSEKIVKETADVMVAKGLLKAGYTYVNLDGGGSYPSGERTLSDHLHREGFKFGVYGNDINYHIPGSESDWAANWALWQADYVKYDCWQTPVTSPTWSVMRDALAHCGRPVFYSAHSSDETVTDSLAGLVNMWRTGPDILVYGKDPAPTFGNVLRNIDLNDRFASFARPGYWNDPDFLMVGIPGGLTFDEEISQFSLWAMAAAPLLIGCDLRTIAAPSLEILLNREVIAVNQDSLGRQGRPVIHLPGPAQVWDRELADGSHAVLLLNRSGKPKIVEVKLADLGLVSGGTVRDLWRHEDLKNVNTSLRCALGPHACAMVRVSGRGTKGQPLIFTNLH